MATSRLPSAEQVAAVIVSAGASTRMNGVDKSMASLAGVPVVARAVEAFERCPAVGTIVLVVSQANLPAVAEMAKERGWRKVTHVRLGGARRQDSVRLGLQALPAECQWVVVHDGARPLVTCDLIERTLLEAGATGAAIAAVPSKDTVKEVAQDGVVVRTLDRASLALVQTPQVFRRDLLDRAHREVTEDVTDDAAMMERIGVPVRVCPGDYGNIKITTPEDLAVAEALLAARKSEAPA